METKHTPGPWFIGEPSGTTIHTNFPLGGEDCWQIIAVCRDFYDGIHGVKEINEIVKANARLISAAPDLYRALVQLAFDVERGAGMKLIEDALQDAKEAISKAEGWGK